MPTRPTAVLFDIDGTLLDDDHAVASALESFHARHAAELRISREELAASWGRLLTVHFGRYLAAEVSMREQRRSRIRDLFAATRAALSDAEADRIFASYEVDYRTAWSAFPDAVPALESLNGFILAVISNGDAQQQTRKLHQCGLAAHFTHLFLSSETGLAKPAPEAFLVACRRLGVPPEDCLYVGNSLETDARASTAARLRGVWLNRDGSLADPGPGIRTIRTLAELPALAGA